MLKIRCGSLQSTDQRAQLCQADVLAWVQDQERFGSVAFDDIYDLIVMACLFFSLYILYLGTHRGTEMDMILYVNSSPHGTFRNNYR